MITPSGDAKVLSEMLHISMIGWEALDFRWTCHTILKTEFEAHRVGMIASLET